ncbi:MAG: hypothetical protein QOE92_729, partial [Chloroflexota bacterium]|nr:hypothetical protein [Chloroflexota bacterium]
MLRLAGRHLATLVATLVVAASAAVVAPVAADAATGAAALPQDRLHFGITSGPDDVAWMQATGVSWRYRYQYLASGVNTPGRWETWQDASLPPGQFALDYIRSSHRAGYIPVLTYYELLQSTPSSGADEAARDYSNLNNAGTMAAYYADFKLLMQRAATAGGTAVVHVEPDLWGYLEQRAANGAQPASTIAASVASSGFAEAQGIPNTAQGFAWALLKLRDTYAPNVLLATHASMWGNGRDLATDHDLSLSPVAVGDATAAFLNSAGIASNPYGSTWDLVFNDVDDHDAGWWEAHGTSAHWWDPANQKAPNFNRYLAWVAELKLRTGRPQVAWQVPVGNQYFLTMNNTCGHYQDNVAAYFLTHAADLASAGLIAVLFGGGNSCTTQAGDATGDGVTNNNGAPTSDSGGGCNACNTHAATVADDDGGFLRQVVGQYYAGPPPPPPPPPPAATGYTFDGWGGVHAFGAAAPAVASGYWPGWDIARGIAVCPGGAGGYTLDGWGGLHRFGNAPPVADGGHAYWPGWNIARGVVLSACSGGVAGYTLDGWGG